MYLKALEIQGFKSFADKTVLSFGEAITAIVGPNGSGKSNVSDALRWVMGEQSYKSLRGSKMEDVIFGGTEKRNQMGFAQVTLILDNSEHIFPHLEESEVAVTRRYNRSGESEYYINKHRVHLADVNELFMDTGMGREGYSIIGQGRIDEILSVKSTDRREIFEEAAGISKYRHRKEKAERDLDRTEENLTRVNDKIAELELQVEPLRVQAEKAKKYQLLYGELRVLEISLWLDQLAELRTNAIKLETDYALAKEELNQVNDDLQALYLTVEQFGEQIQDNDIRQEQIRTAIAELDSQIGEQDSAIAVLKTDIVHNDENIARVEEELRDQSGRESSMARQIEEKEDRIADLDSRIAELQESVQELSSKLEELARGVGEANGEVEALRAKETLLRATASDNRADAAAARSGLHEIEERKKALASERSEVERQLDETRKKASENRRALDDAQENADAIRNIIKGYTMKMEGRVRREADASEKRVALTMDLNNTDSHIKMLSDMEKEYEGFNRAVKEVMQGARGNLLHGIHGPLANLMSTERKYSVAIEIALGGKMQDIVVDREEDAKAAIQLLKRKESGRATFQPLSAVHGTELREKGLADENGYVGIASSLVQCEARYQSVFASVLGTTVIAENLDCGIRISRKYSNRFRIVTLDGQVINRGGSMTGGSVSRNAGILSRANELKELRAKRTGLLEKVSAAEREAAEAKNDLNKAQYELQVAQEQEHEAEAEVIRLRGNKSTYDSLLSAAQNRLDTIEAEEESLERRVADLNRSIAEKEAVAVQQENEAEMLKAEADKRISGQNALLRDSGTLGEKITEQKSALAGCHAERDATALALHELERLREQIKSDKDGRTHLLAEYHASNERAEQEIKTRESRIDEMREEQQRHRDALQALNQEKLAVEAERSQSQRSIKDLNDHVLNASKLVSKLEERIAVEKKDEEQILVKLWDTYELSHSAAMEQRIELESAAKAGKRIAELKRGIASLGTVNVGAIEQFAQINERYTYLTSQRDDIEQAKKDLLGVIDSITNEMTGIFKEQFQLIRSSFQETFLELFGGGRATLELEDENDVLNCGIEIKVQPPGKALKIITLLSGGEKAFVAIALYFAILKVHPTPFCVMDEIEAALDAANVIRVAHYMRRISDKTQFIVITHRHETMELSDVLYGVTMQERGISKVITININDMAKELAIKE